MLKSKCAVLILTLCFLSTVLADSVLADSVENEAESKDCTAKVIACAGAVTGGAGAIIKECKALRQCKKECREEKRDCKKEARGEKKSCKDECRDQFGTGKDYRNCADVAMTRKKKKANARKQKPNARMCVVTLFERRNVKPQEFPQQRCRSLLA
jgi:hypothetical protein